MHYLLMLPVLLVIAFATGGRAELFSNAYDAAALGDFRQASAFFTEALRLSIHDADKVRRDRLPVEAAAPASAPVLTSALRPAPGPLELAARADRPVLVASAERPAEPAREPITLRLRGSDGFAKPAPRPWLR